jgi:hypothetical protein
MKKILLVVLVTLLAAEVSFANPYSRALQKARDVRTQVETVSDPENYFQEERKDQQNQQKNLRAEYDKLVAPKYNTSQNKNKAIENTPAKTTENVVKECVCPNCKLIYNAKLREKHTKGKIKYVPPKCPCFKGGKCPTK